MGEPAPLSLHYHIVVLAVKSQNEIIRKKQPTRYAPHFQNIKYHYFFFERCAVCLGSFKNTCKLTPKWGKLEDLRRVTTHVQTKLKSQKCCQFIERTATSVALVAIKDLQHTENKEQVVLVGF